MVNKHYHTTPIKQSKYLLSYLQNKIGITKILLHPMGGTNEGINLWMKVCQQILSTGFVTMECSTATRLILLKVMQIEFLQNLTKISENIPETLFF